ncbi:MAG: hypothetical protein ABEK01_02395 [Candidatus Nanohaloarchaea archaeon]
MDQQMVESQVYLVSLAVLVLGSAWVSVEEGITSGVIFMMAALGIGFVYLVMFESWREHLRHHDGS